MGSNSAHVQRRVRDKHEHARARSAHDALDESSSPQRLDQTSCGPFSQPSLLAQHCGYQQFLLLFCVILLTSLVFQRLISRVWFMKPYRCSPTLLKKPGTPRSPIRTTRARATARSKTTTMFRRGRQGREKEVASFDAT